ncbi:hypothetical protein ACIBTV_25600 [Micromonospora sp. NPDC049366]|uniref:hypothetical protein n=1 Tax=Micromonospora sp. NPDC049366 TaxID=3364271 RepID=UPI00378CC09A
MTLDVTDGNSALCTADPEGAPAERETWAGEPEALQSAITKSDGKSGWIRVWITRARANFTPPDVFREQRPSVEQLKDYAYRARYTNRTRGARRYLGVAWCYCVAIPVALRSRLREWMWQVPSRALVVLVTVKLLSFLPPVAWLADHVVKPTVQFALWLIL